MPIYVGQHKFTVSNNCKCDVIHPTIALSSILLIDQILMNVCRKHFKNDLSKYTLHPSNDELAVDRPKDQMPDDHWIYQVRPPCMLYFSSTNI